MDNPSFFKNQDLIIVAFVHQIGVNIQEIKDKLEERFLREGYQVEHVKVSEFILGKSYLNSKLPPYKLAEKKIKDGDKKRKTKGSNCLALKAAKEIKKIYKNKNDKLVVFIDSLKHQEEVHCLRYIFKRCLLLIGTYDADRNRLSHLRNKFKMKDNEEDNKQIEKLFEKDAHDASSDYGQKTMDTFALADFIINLDIRKWQYDIDRLLNLLFDKNKIAPPNLEEYAMNLAFQVSARSSHHKRQVGAIILDQSGQIISTGYNEKPSHGGLQIINQLDKNERESTGQDTRQKQNLSDSLYDALNEKLEGTSKEEFENLIQKSKASDIIEYIDEVHAEQAAIIEAARKGQKITEGSSIFVTTYPCHLCIKHIIAAGISKVYYVEPYFKSLTADMFSDHLNFDSSKQKSNQVNIIRYHGIGWKMYELLFRRNLNKFEKSYQEISLVKHSFERLKEVEKISKPSKKKK